VAIAAIITVVMQNRPRLTSSLASQFDPKLMLNQTIKDHNLPGRAYRSHGRGGSSMETVHRDIEVKLRDVSEADVKSVLMPALRKQIGEAIRVAGFGIEGSGVSGSKGLGDEWSSIKNFAYHYGSMRTRGHLRVHTTFASDGTPMLIITLDEY